MKKFYKYFCFIFLLFTTISSYAVSYPEGSPVAINGKLKVSGTQLVSECGNLVQLRGMSTHGPQWFKECYKKEALEALVKDWKISVFRLAMYVEEGGYVNNPSGWRNWIDEFVGYCGELGIYCVIDWHVLNPGNPNENLSKAKEFWDYMSKKHKDEDHVLYEICNEPNGVKWINVKEYAEQILSIIRGNNDNTIVIVGTPTWSQDVDQASYNPLDDKNVMYTLHFYAGSHGGFLRTKCNKALSNGIPIFVTEFGTSDASGDDNYSPDETQTWITYLNKKKISWINWSFCDKNEVSAALNPGACNSNNWNNTSKSGTFIKKLISEDVIPFVDCESTEINEENKQNEDNNPDATTFVNNGTKDENQDDNNQTDNHDNNKNVNSKMNNSNKYPKGSAVAINGKLKVSGTQLVSKCGNAVQLRGMSTHGPQWFKECYKKESLEALVKDWEISVFRLAMYVGEGGYVNNPSGWREWIDEFVGYCGELGIYCVIDWHVLNPGDPNANLSDAKEFWDYMSKKHKDEDHVLYEICNEPNGVNWPVVKEYAEQILSIIRGNNDNTIVIVGTPTWSQDVDEASNSKLNDDNVMYTLHFYAGTHTDYLRKKCTKALENNAPIFVTEFGTSSASGDSNFSPDETKKWINYLNERKISWINWSFCDKNEVSAALNPGACNSNAWNNTSNSGTLIKSLISENKIDFIDCGDNDDSIEENQDDDNALFKNNNFNLSDVESIGLSSVSVRPTLVDDEFFVDGDEYDRVELFSILGVKIKNFDKSNSYNISMLPAGTYIVAISLNGRLLKNISIIKE